MTKLSIRCLLLVSAATLAGCGAVNVAPTMDIPVPLVERVPATVGVHYSAAFRDYVHKEKRQSTEYAITLGAAHVTGLGRLLNVMFDKVVEVESPAAAATLTPAPALTLDPHFEEYSFLTPRDVSGGYFAVTIAYRFDIYDSQGRRVDSLRFSGFGREPETTMGGTDEPLRLATRRAMRDAGSKVAVELTAQDSVARLLRGEAVEPMKSPEELAAEETARAVVPLEPAAPTAPESPQVEAPPPAPSTTGSPPVPPP
jgi:hypothetical protein